MEASLQTYRALVCGASQGIGAACARALAARGAAVTVLSRQAEALARVVESLKPAPNGEHHYLAVDMADTSGLRAAVAEHVEAVGPVHIVVHNSGGPAAGPVFEAEPQAFVQAFQQHVVSAQTLAQTVVPGMTQAGFGRFINIISTSVKQPLPGLGVSNTVRAAMANWAKTLATELAGRGITVNNVLPGATRTARLESLMAGRAQRTGVDSAAVEEAMLKQIPAGRFGTPEEVAAAVAFLASPEAAYITGINLPVDGGRTSSL